MMDSLIKQLQEMRLPAMVAKLEVLSEKKEFSKEKPEEIMDKIITAEYLRRKEQYNQAPNQADSSH